MFYLLFVQLELLWFSDYVNHVKEIVFSTSEEDLNETSDAYKKRIPEPLYKQFPARRSKASAIKRHQDRQAQDPHELCPTSEFLF